jgi:hypothetical protein
MMPTTRKSCPSLGLATHFGLDVATGELFQQAVTSAAVVSKTNVFDTGISGAGGICGEGP